MPRQPTGGTDYVPVGRFIRNILTIEKVVSRYCSRMLPIRLVSVTVQILGIGAAVAGAYLVGLAVTGTPLSLMWPLIGAFVLLTIGSIFLQQYNSYLSHTVAFRALAGMRKAIYVKFDELAPAYILDRRSGELARSALSDVNLLELYIAHTLPDLWQAFIVTPLILLAMGAIHWSLAIAVAPFLILATTVPDWLADKAQAHGRQLRRSSGDMTAEIVDGIQGLREILLFGGTRQRMDRLDTSLGRYASAFIGHEGRSGFERGASDILLTLGMLATSVVGAYLVTTGRMDAAVYPAVTVLAAMAFHPVMTLTAIARDLNKAAAAAERVFEIMGAEPSVKDMTSVSPSCSSMPEVRFENVSFRYQPGLPEVLKAAVLAFPAGKTTALVGHSGAGKSTCSYLLLRLWDPSEGAVYVDGHDLRVFRQADLRALIAYVPQDVYLFNMTVLENLRMGRGDATDDEVKEAARRACALDFIEALPDKWDTVLGERGSTLSGGQRQRIAIARALLKDAPILLMDEAVSNLDTESEAAIRAAIKEASSGRTTIIIAHRPSTIRAADRIVLLENGRVVGSGTYEELVGQRTGFATLIGVG
jgi:ATP-binding cassette, subfamily C, bacterial CydC